MADLIEGGAQVAGVRPDGFLATKLHVPQSLPGFVTRSRLTTRIADGLERAVTLLCAPAGSGKTALLADCVQRSGRPIAWVTVDSGDNDPVRLWRHVVAAFDRIWPGTAERVDPMFGPPTPSSFEVALGALINELEARCADEDVVLVLDDYHQVDSPAVHGSLAFLMEHLPPQVHLVVSARADPPLPLARLRAGGQLAELRASDLRFTREESAAVLRNVVGRDLALTDASLSALETRTEGWAAGLQLAGLSLRDHPDVDRFIATFSGSHRYVLDYLTEEVLERQPSEVRAFLLETSVLDRMSGELCDALTGRTDSQAMLEAIERANLFLVPLDDVRGWWRYHHLFADLLRVRLSQERRDQLADLHLRAADWYEQHGLPDDAIHHALAAGDALRAARLVEHHADGCIQGGREATLRRWLAAMPADVVASRPRLLLARSLVALLEGDLPVLEESLDAAEQALAGDSDDDFESSVGVQSSWMANVPAMIARGRGALAEFRGDADRALAFSRQAVALVGEGEHMLQSLSWAVLGRAERLAGRLGDAERTFTRLIDRSRATGQPALVAWASHLLAQVQQAKGDLDGANRTYQRALEVVRTSGPTAPLPGAIAHLGLAEVAYQRDELDDAVGHVTEGIALSRQAANATLVASGLTTLAWIRQSQGDEDGARQAISQAADLGLGSEVVDLINPVPARRAHLLLAQGDVNAAAAWSLERGLGADDDPLYALEPAYLTFARILRAQGRATEASGLLATMHARATKEGRTGSVLEIQVLQALTLAAMGEEDRARSSLADSLRLAQPHGYVRLFADEGQPMGGLLRGLLESQTRSRSDRDVRSDYVTRLLTAIDVVPLDPPGPSPGRSRTIRVPGLVEALSEREMEVLVLLAAGRANREIADELFVTVHTVKKHITHLLGKLGAANRTEAAARARDLGLLS